MTTSPPTVRTDRSVPAAGSPEPNLALNRGGWSMLKIPFGKFMLSDLYPPARRTAFLNSSATAMELRNYITAKISRGEQQGYVAECPEINVVTQGRSKEEIVSNLQEAVALYLEDEDPT